jgi:hypothetical protein
MAAKNKTSKSTLKAVAAADQANAKARDARAAAPDGMTASERAVAATAKGTGLSATMRKVAAEDKAKAAERAKAADAPTHATPPTTPRGAKGGKKAGKATPKPKAAPRANGGANGAKAAKGRRGKADPHAEAPRRLSALDAAAQVLAKGGAEMSAREMVAAMTEQGLWSSPGGKTPDATLYSAIIREIGAKGGDSRFKKTNRGRFASNGKRA